LLTGDKEAALLLVGSFVRGKLEAPLSLDEAKEFLLWISGQLTRIIQSQNWPIRQVVGEDVQCQTMLIQSHRDGLIFLFSVYLSEIGWWYNRIS
jgi:hypothetical protein